jgi:hypothetical protein
MFDHSNPSAAPFPDSPRVKRQKSSSYSIRADSKRRGQVMLYPWIMLGIEANRVVGLRVMKLMLGGKSARREARMMVTEKIRAGLEANARLMAGASPDEVIRTYRRRVAANAKRLSKPYFGGSVRKRKQRIKRP